MTSQAYSEGSSQPTDRVEWVAMVSILNEVVSSRMSLFFKKSVICKFQLSP